MNKIRYTFYVTAYACDHACANVGQATHACIEATWDLSLGIETVEEVRRNGLNTVRRLTYVRIRTMGGSVRSLHRECTDSLRDVVMRSV